MPQLCNAPQYASCVLVFTPSGSVTYSPTTSSTGSYSATSTLTASSSPVPSSTATQTATVSTSMSSTASLSPSSTLSSSFSVTAASTPHVLPALSDSTLFQGCSSQWIVPPGVRSVEMRLWGGGGGGLNGSLGGPGAFVEGVAYVTPGETLVVASGAAGSGYGQTPACGNGGIGVAWTGCYYYANVCQNLYCCSWTWYGCAGNCCTYYTSQCQSYAPRTYYGASGGGATSVSRWNVFYNRWDVIAVAGGGGGASDTRGLPGSAIPPSGCGAYSPNGNSGTAGLNGATAPTDYGGGGGGGWIGGAYHTGGGGGSGGTSCAPFLVNGTVSSFAARSNGDSASDSDFLSFTSPYWPGSLVGLSGQSGAVHFAWSNTVGYNLPNATGTPSGTPSWTSSPSITPTSTPTPSQSIPYTGCAACLSNSSASVCCDCCDSYGALQLGWCNDPKYSACWPGSLTATPSATSSSTSAPSPSATLTPTGTGSPSTSATSAAATVSQTASLPYANVIFTGGCANAWTVPAGVRSVTVRLWGGGGASCVTSGTYYGAAGSRTVGGVGAYVEGVADVTPGETLFARIGATDDACSFGGDTSALSQSSCCLSYSYHYWSGGYTCDAAYPCQGGRGGGATTFSRWDTVTQSEDIIAMAGGGGGALCLSISSVFQGQPGAGIPAGGCGPYSPQGAPASMTYWPNYNGTGAGGGGWQGGVSAGAGGTSCAQGLLLGSIRSLPWAQVTSSPFRINNAGDSDSAGLVSISWLPIVTPTASLPASSSMEPSPPASPSWTPSAALSSSSSPSLTPSPSVSLTAMPTVSLTGSAHAACPATLFRTFPSHDLVGTPATAATGGPSGATLAASESDCQRACCASPDCTGYAFSAFMQQLVGPTAPCFLLSNVTQLVPNHFLTAGVLASAMGS